MNQEVTVTHFRRWLLLYAQRIEEEEPRLTQLDAAIGDADHGVNMVRGMTKVRARLIAPADAAEQSDFSTDEDIGTLLRQVAMSLISSVGGAAGPLYGAFFLWAAKQAGATHTVTPVQLAGMLRMGLEGIQQRGKAQPGDKTMIDVLTPAIDALEAAAAQALSLQDSLEHAVAAAEAGMQATVALQARKGRASYLGARSVGHMDPGAASAFLLIRCAAQTLGKDETGVSAPQGADAWRN